MELNEEILNEVVGGLYGKAYCLSCGHYIRSFETKESFYRWMKLGGNKRRCVECGSELFELRQ